MSSKRISLLALFAAALFLATCTRDEPPPAEPILKSVTFGMLPYGDHTYAIIGVKKGWFREVGIDLEYKAIKVEQIVPFLVTGTLDLCSSPPGILIAAYKNAPGLCSFVFGDLFQGYAIMAQPDGEYKSYGELRQSGLSPDEAIRTACEQLRNKVFAFPTEAAIKPFIDLVLAKADMTVEDVEALVLDDPLTVNAMRNGRADFQVGGVPSRLVLEREGFKPIITSIDLVEFAAPSPDSPELASILQNSWATTKKFYREQYATILRVASVNYRIIEFMNTNRDEAIELHMAYLSQISGQPFTREDGLVIYSSLDPFVTFDEQHPWFHDPENPLYYAHVNGAIINAHERNGVFKGSPPNVDDVVFADDIYMALEHLKASSEALFTIIVREGLADSSPEVAAKLERARHYYEIYDYLDSERLAREIFIQR